MSIELDIMKVGNGNATLRSLVAIAMVFAVGVSCGQEPARVTNAEITPAGEFRIEVMAPAGELLLERTEDFVSWIPAFPTGTTGGLVEMAQGADSAKAFFRLLSSPDSDDEHLNGAAAQEIRASIPYASLQAIFGLDAANPPASPVTVVRNLPSAGRNERLYAASIGILSILAQNVINSEGAAPLTLGRSLSQSGLTVEDVVAALAEDLASGSLNGFNSAGERIEIGTSGVLLPAYDDQELIAAVAQLNNVLSGLRNVEIQVINGLFITSAPADWNRFYWDCSEWK